MKKRITITLSTEIIKAVKIEAIKADTKVSTLVEKLLKNWLEQRVNKKD